MRYYVYNRPENRLHHENPVRFTWFPQEGVTDYAILVDRPDGTRAYRFEGIDANFFTPPIVMEAGEYRYSVLADGREIVSGQPFAIAGDAARTPLSPREGRYDAIGGHPRIWLGEEDILRLRSEKDAGLKPQWDAFIERSAAIWLDRPVHDEPARYPGDVRKIPLWRQMYIDCQEAFCAVRHCAVAWRGTGDTAYLAAAKRWLLALAGWDTKGATARAYNDEAAFRVTSALAWGYDWLHGDLTEAERGAVRDALLVRGRELFDYVKNQIQIHIKLLDSHGVRSLSMTLVPAALALYGEAAEAREWLDYTIEYFFTLFTPWGGEDGGWAEGPAYWQTGVSFFTEAICLLRKATGIDAFQRPFFQNTGDFPLYAYCQDMRFMAFGDISDLGDYPGLKAGYTMRILSAVSDSPRRHEYAWYYEQAKKRNVGTEGRFYNYGWWDFPFDELFFRMLFTPVTPAAPQAGLAVRRFDDIGWVCLHENMADEARHIAFMFKASPYGAVSHSHGDQNAFVLHAFGEPLAIQSGYYVGFWSEMHLNWRRQTKSKNAILIDGVGQFSAIRRTTAAEEFNGSAKSQYESLIAANGRVEACEEREGYVYIRGDATNAFAATVPYLRAYKRHVLYAGGLFIVIDDVTLDREGTVDWLLHGLAPFTLGENACHLRNGVANLDVRFVGTDMRLTQSDVFDGVDPAEAEGMPAQWHMRATTTRAASRHSILTVLYPYREGEAEPLAAEAGQTPRIRLGDRTYTIHADGEGYVIR